MKAEGQKYKKK